MHDFSQIKVSLIQTDLVWEDQLVNLNNFSRKLKKLYGTTDLVILPEMFTTGFSMRADLLACNSDIYEFLKHHAAKGKFAIYGSVMFNNDGVYVNRGVFMKPDGSFYTYDKRHCFTLAGEHKTYRSGNRIVIVDYLGWRFNLQICYDLRFPVFARNTQYYDALIYIANWPEKRINAWDALLKARSIENMCYTIGVNIIGHDGNNINYNGHSQVYDVLGNELIDNPWIDPDIRSVVLTKSHITHYRNKYRFLEDRDDFNLI